MNEPVRAGCDDDDGPGEREMPPRPLAPCAQHCKRRRHENDKTDEVGPAAHTVAVGVAALLRRGRPVRFTSCAVGGRSVRASSPTGALRADATLCLREAAATDLTGTEPANALALASRRVESAAAADLWTVAEAIDAARPDLSIRQARDIMQARLDHCLVEHGYHRFRLTDDQRRRLNHFSLRQPERQVYLHSLASDPQVLASQSVEEPATH